MLKLLTSFTVFCCVILGGSFGVAWLIVHADWLGLRRLIGSLLFYAILFYIAACFRAVARYVNSKATRPE